MSAGTTGLYREHVTRDGVRWDSLAYAYYGDPYRVEPILAANPHVPMFPRLPGGLTLLIPILPVAAVLPSIEGKPPWK